MPANTKPIFTVNGNLVFDATTGMAQPILLAANDYTGAGANNRLVFTAHATNPSFIQRLRFKAVGTNIQTVARIYLNNGSNVTVAANNSLIGEMTLLAVTASANAATPDYDYPLNFVMEPGFRLYVGLGTAVAAGWVVTPVAGDY